MAFTTVSLLFLRNAVKHPSVTVNIRGQSYRLREKRKAGIFSALESEKEE